MSKRLHILLPALVCLSFAFLDLFWSRATGWMLSENLPDWFMNYRLPRVLGAVLSGMALSVAGLALQTLFRNPLAGPFLTGITPGASFAIAILLLLFPTGISNQFFHEFGVSGMGILGGVSILMLQLFIVRRTSGIFTLLLTGVMLSYLLGAAVEMMETIASAEQIRSFVMWGMGNFDRVQMDQIWWFGPLVLVGILWLFLYRFQMDAWLPGHLYAQNAGVNTGRFRFGIICLTGLLAGATTAVSGPIGFVGLAAPHVSRLLLKSNNHTRLIVPTALWGAGFCIVADIVAHNAFENITLNVNGVCAIIGAPMVLWIILRNKI